MLSKLNPQSFIIAHFRTFTDYRTGKISRAEVLLFLLLPLLLAVIHVLYFTISEGVISIVVSAASIVAGLMLNLMVLIYTLVVNNKGNAKLYSNFNDFNEICRETLATVAYSVLLCVLLVVGALMCLTDNAFFYHLGWLVMVYAGVAVLFCLLIILKRSYLLINFDFDVIPQQ